MFQKEKNVLQNETNELLIRILTRGNHAAMWYVNKAKVVLCSNV